MSRMLLRCLLLFYLAFTSSLQPRRQVSRSDPASLLNYCIDSRHHKNAPSREPDLYQECAPWRENSCCTVNTSFAIHRMQLYSFNFDHCANKTLSPACRLHFVREHCFFECSPNGGPWMVKVDMKTRRERFYHAPLCRSFCIDWFEACKNDFTCTDNWMRNFEWRGGSNRCPSHSHCRTFAQVYTSAENFCQVVWDDAWTVVDDEQSCLQPWFESATNNPNTAAAQFRVQQLQRALMPTGSSSISPTTCSVMMPLLILGVVAL